MAAAYYLQHQFPVAVYEASERLAGNCKTFELEGFRYDSGAHRLHDKDPETTALFKSLLGKRLRLIHVPSQIMYQGKRIDFPLSPVNLLRKLGPGVMLKAAGEIAAGRIRPQEINHFEDHAVQSYGRTLSQKFLLEYSAKLWGVPTSKLATEVAGGRLKGLDLKTMLIEAFRGQKGTHRHLDGSFYYPDLGIEVLFEALEKASTNATFHTRAPIQALHHENGRITAITSAGQRVSVDGKVVSSLPLGPLIHMLDPAPSAAILEAVQAVRFRNLVLAVFCLNKPAVNANGSMYFPEARYPFTRAYEPRNRSADMSPEGKTSLIVEWPCQPEDEVWQRDDTAILSEIQSHLSQIGLFTPAEVLHAKVERLPHAYPILSTDYADTLAPVFRLLSDFSNLHLTGRNGLFQYSHIHDHMRNGRKAAKWASQTPLQH